jgi:hypothetical protein
VRRFDAEDPSGHGLELLAASGAEILTPRLRLRGWTPADEPAMAAINADPEVTRHLNRAVDEAAVAAFLGRALGHWDEHGDAFARLGLPELISIIHPDNDRSQRVAAVAASSLPGGVVATAVHRGDYSGLDGAHRAVRVWCAEHGRELAGPRWEVYGHWRGEAATAETEISYLLR